MKIRLFTKKLICWAGFGDKLIEFCEDCGRKQSLVWHANDELWLKLMKKRNGVVCPECFNKRASNNGMVVIWNVDGEI